MGLDHMWVLVSACFVFFMQAGFICYEVGFIQSKNVVSVAIENILAFVITAIVFFLFGFGIMFGGSVNGFIGNGFWLLDGIAQSGNSLGYLFVFFQLMFAGTAVTIFSGSMSERTRLPAMIIAAIGVGGIIYPIFGHWVWGGLFESQPTFLKAMGYVDFAGATVVHGTAGWVALAGICVVGARKDKWDANGKLQKLGRSNIPFAALGTFILWFSWFGFNGGSLLRFDDSVAQIILNTNLAASSGVLGAVFISKFFIRQVSFMESIFNGALGGLVAITAGYNALSPASSLILGFIAGMSVVAGSHALERFHLDDAVGAVSIHGFGGAVGAIMFAILTPEKHLEAGSRMNQLLVQFLGVAVNFIWAFGLGFIMFFVIKKTIGIRVTPEEEDKGLNIVEFSDIYSWQDYLKVTHYENLTQDLYDKISDQNKLLKRQADLLVATQDQERIRLARDLHDGLGQYLAALKLQLGIVKTKFPKGEDAIIDTAISTVQETIDEMRNVIFNLKPDSLKKDGLISTVRTLVDKVNQISEINLHITASEEIPQLEEAEVLNVYRIIQESMTNVIKHSNAKNVEIIISRMRKNVLFVSISDDGIGFDIASSKNGLGLTSIKERAAMLNGSIQIKSSNQGGTSITLEVPYEPNSN